jgi:hypothetical protein
MSNVNKTMFDALRKAVNDANEVQRAMEEKVAGSRFKSQIVV